MADGQRPKDRCELLVTDMELQTIAFDIGLELDSRQTFNPHMIEKRKKWQRHSPDLCRRRRVLNTESTATHKYINARASATFMDYWKMRWENYESYRLFPNMGDSQPWSNELLPNAV